MSAKILTPDVESLIKVVSENEDILKYDISDVQFNQKGEGFLGEICLVTVTDKDSEKSLKIVMKMAFKSEKLREMVPIRLTFENEIYFYRTVYPAMRQFEENKIITSPELVPKCYTVSLEEEREGLVLENLKSMGFQTFNKKEMLDSDHLEMIFKNYGRFHAYSFALRDQDPEKFAKLADGILPVLQKFVETPPFGDAMKLMCAKAATFLNPDDDEISKKFEKYLTEPIKFYADCLNPNEHYSAIIHGDCWSNNMLFKYEKSGNVKKVIDMRLIDFQLMVLASPICDLSYFFYSGAAKEDLDKLEQYLKIYHESFSCGVKKLGSDPDKLFPFEVLKKQWNTYCRYGMMMSLMLFKMKLTESEDTYDMNDYVESNGEDMTKFMETPCNEAILGQRTRDLLVHLHEIDAL